MLRKKVWQRGSADLISVAVGMTILAIVTGGTAAAMVYGRELTAHEEHYKTAAYALRGAMEAGPGRIAVRGRSAGEGEFELDAHYGACALG